MVRRFPPEEEIGGSSPSGCFLFFFLFFFRTPPFSVVAPLRPFHAPAVVTWGGDAMEGAGSRISTLVVEGLFQQLPLPLVHLLREVHNELERWARGQRRVGARPVAAAPRPGPAAP